MNNEIKLYEQSVDLARYPKREVEVYNALQTSLISTKSEPDLYDIFNNAITKAYMIATYTPPEPAAFSLIVDETMKIYKDRFGFIREDEIDLIFTRGLSKEYGDFMGLSFITFVDWAKAYAKDSVRIKLTMPPQGVKQPTDDELYQVKKINALSALNEFKKNNTCGRYATVVYDFFCELKLIDLTQEEKNEYWRLSKEEFSTWLINQKGKMMTMDEKRRIEKDYASFLEGGKKDRLIVISKRLIVDDFFKSIVFEETDLLTLINLS